MGGQGVMTGEITDQTQKAGVAKCCDRLNEEMTAMILERPEEGLMSRGR